MAVRNAMYLFEVVVEKVNSFVESRLLIIRSEFGEIFSLELKDPKQMHIVIPDPPPLPPEPPGKKGKKKAPPKKGKKGKKGQVEVPPPEPLIQSGQSVLFTSSAELLIQYMNKFPMEVSLWSKEDNLVCIGSSTVPWDPVFLLYLDKICKCESPSPPSVRDEYNVFEEGTAKLMAKIGLQVKLTYLTDRVLSSFRTLTEDVAIKKVLYTGMNSKTTSYICNYKTTDEDFEENCNKIENNFIKDDTTVQTKPVVFADYRNAPSANVAFFTDGDYCCLGQADKPPESKYKPPVTCPDIDFIVDYVRKIITSCNDSMRMLTPRPTIRPRIKATDIDKLCYCRETRWPDGALADRFKRETKKDPCPLCINAKPPGAPRENTLDIANIRGPCGRADCRIARDLRAYLENIVAEDNVVLQLEDIIGPCGSKTCTLAEKIQEFLRHEGVFKDMATVEGLSTQCACVQKMQEALFTRESCASVCSKDCEDATSDDDRCDGKGCPHNKQIYQVYYFTVEHDMDKSPNKTPSQPTSKASSSINTSISKSPSSAYKNCPPDCPSVKDSEAASCSKNACGSMTIKKGTGEPLKCVNPVCPTKQRGDTVSPADSDIVIQFDDIHNPCCVKTCPIADDVKSFIEDGLLKKKSKKPGPLDEDPCYCDCECNFGFTSKTTYCPVCGGYECLGNDMTTLPEHAKPHPCPVYHKLYDKEYIKVKSPWPAAEEEVAKQKTRAPRASDAQSMKSWRTVGSKQGTQLTTSRSLKGVHDKKASTPTGKTKKKDKKTIGKFTANVDEPLAASQTAEKKVEPKHYHHAPVPKNMGWLWTAEDIPGLKSRPKWKPGAANKLLVRRYRTIREGVDNIAKKKRAMMQRKKKIEMKPTLVVKKQDGEYTVQMEVFKKYSKERLLFQYPYDEKPPLIYTIGKTEEERMKTQKQRDRRERRETRRKSRLLQSTFRDKCQEICLKSYNQAMGILPLPNPNNPECPCEVEAMKGPSPIIDSCSCSDEVSISSSDTDNDDWIVEFTPPMARWDTKAKHPPVVVDNESQYNYMDYKVKLLDKQGNPVPRFFKGPDGKEECSDLGGFWSPDHQWLEISRDGYIGPDGRWVPMNFIGPDGMFYSSEDGAFTDSKGKVWKIGVDGYVDKDSKWVWYNKPKRERGTKSLSTMTCTTDTKRSHLKKQETPKGPAVKGKVDAKVSDRSPTAAVKPSVKGKTGDKKGVPSAAPTMKVGIMEKGKITKAPTKGLKGKNPLIMNFSLNYDGRKMPQVERIKPMDARKMDRYQEIMNGLNIYGDLPEFRPAPLKTNRASNTPRKKVSPFTMDPCLRKLNAQPSHILASSLGCSTICTYGSENSSCQN